MKCLAHARAVLVTTLAGATYTAWLWPRAVRAETLETELHRYDWTSLGYAAGLGLLGGCLALIVALATDKRVVTQVLVESGRNALVSPIAGMAAYLLMKAAAAQGLLHLGTEPRFLVIVGCGWGGIAFFVWLRTLAGKLAVNLASHIVNRSKKS